MQMAMAELEKLVLDCREWPVVVPSPNLSPN
jgi:hypothetical protein